MLLCITCKSVSSVYEQIHVMYARLQTTVDDVLALRDACGLNDDDVAGALRERAQIVYFK
jgi:hypothetical protein